MSWRHPIILSHRSRPSPISPRLQALLAGFVLGVVVGAGAATGIDLLAMVGGPR